jgi:tight adherence protein C
MPVPVEYLPHVTAALAFLFVIILAWAWMQYTRSQAQRKTLFDKIQFVGQISRAGQSIAPVPETSGNGSISDLLGKLGKRVVPNKVMNPLDSRIRFLRAGLRDEKALAVFWGVKVILTVLLPALFLLSNSVMIFVIPTSGKFVLSLAILALIGYYSGDLWLYNRGLQRKEAVLDGFPDALDLLVVCVEAGMGLDAAMNRVSREIQTKNSVLSEELTIYSLEMRAGMQRRDALKNLSLRTDLVEVNRLTTLLVQTDKFGTSVGNALKVFSDNLRIQRYQRAEELAGKIPIKLLFPMILFVFPSLFVVILGPAVIRIYHTMIK